MEKVKSLRNSSSDSSVEGQNVTDKVLKAQGKIWNHASRFVSLMSLRCAIELGIFDAIHKHNNQTTTVSDLASTLPINPSKSHCLHRLMRMLSHSGFLNLDSGGGGYSLTDSSRLLLRDGPYSMAPYLRGVLDPSVARSWERLGEWFGNGDETAFETAHGGLSYWEYMAREPAMGRHFDEAMVSDSRLLARVVVERFGSVFEGVGTLVDVGGGTGTVARAVAEAFPWLDCVVFDLPNVVKGEEVGGDYSNVRFVGGDMFDAIPPGDAILLKWILHNWSDEDSVKILKKCKEAIVNKGKENGKVIIIDMIVENENCDHEDVETQIFYDLEMMVLFNGKERNENEWAKLFNDAGFSNYNITHILGLRSLIEVYP